MALPKPGVSVRLYVTPTVLLLLSALIWYVMVYWFAAPVAVGPDKTVFEMTRVVADAVLLLVSGSLTLEGAVMVAVLVTAHADGLASSANAATASVAGSSRRHCMALQ